MTLLTGAALILAGATDARAELIKCDGSGTSTNLLDKVHDDGTPTQTSAVSDCEYVDPPDESNIASIANINTAGFFGFTDWNDNGQTQVGEGGELSSGTWSIADFNPFLTYLIVFKDGSGTNLIAFLFNNLFSSGGWDSPFTDPPFSLGAPPFQKDVSHYTIAWRDGGDDIVPIPEPALLLLMGIGLAVGGRRLRRRA